MSKEAMKLALEALEYIEHNYMSLPAPAEKAITALREALAEQPTQRTWVALTDEDYRELHLEMGPTYFYQDYGRAIEAKLKEKNQ